jgi:hypothetical protein
MTHQEAFNLKSLLFDIINGYSQVVYKNKPCFIKHYSIFDSLSSDSLYEDFFNLAKNNKLPTNEEKLVYLKQNELWSESEDNLLKDKHSFLMNLRENRSKLTLLQSQYKQYTAEIEKAEAEIGKLENKKNQLLGITCENFALRKINSINIFNSFFSDRELKLKFFTNETFEELDDDEINNLINIHNETTLRFNEKMFNKIAIFPIFLRFFGLCDNDPVKLYGKRVLELTFYQEELFYKGCYFKNIFSEMKNNISPEILENPDELISLYESGKNAGSQLEKNTGMARGIMGASKEDYIKMGMGDQLGPDLASIAKQKGGKLNMMDIIQAHGMG